MGRVNDVLLLLGRYEEFGKDETFSFLLRPKSAYYFGNLQKRY